MTLTDESPEGPGDASPPADEQPALALLKLIEEKGATGRLHVSEVYELYQRADGLLKETEDAEALSRLRACARVVMRKLAGPEIGREGFKMYEAVHDFEARLIEQALELEDGSLTRAAKRLGLKHQSLSHMLQSRHPQLLGKRTPPTPRRRSIIKKNRG